MRRFRLTLGVAIALGVCGLVPASAQQVALAERGPRFLMSERDGPRPVDVGRTAVLQRRISLDLRDVTLGEALDAIVGASGLRLGYSSDVAPVGRVVRLVAEDITVAGALSVVLLDTGVDVLFQRDGQAALVRRPEAPTIGTVAGRVTDAVTGEPIAAADVRVVGTPIAVTTDDRGEYVLRDVPAGQRRITARRIGYEAQTLGVTIAAGGTATLDFALKVVATRLDELVTTATGEQRRLEVGNAVVSLNADSLMQTAPVMSFGDLLQGRAPGVLSLQESGMSGQAGTIRIRGLNSIQLTNDPVVVIDGARVEGGAGRNDFDASSGIGGRLSDLNPDEIASVEIVKGPSAATLYGTDAANGVIVITTKRGQPGRTRWTAFTEQGLLRLGLDQRDNYPDAYYAFGRSSADNSPQRCTLLQRAEGSCVVDSLTSFNSMSDPATRPIKDSWREQYGVQASGGTAGGSTYFLSGDYEQETGPAFMPELDQRLIERTQARVVPDWQVRPNAFERMNLRANATTPLGRRGSVTLATGFVSNQARQPGRGIQSGQVGYRDANDGWSTLGGTFNLRPAYTFPLRDEDVVRRFTASLASTYGIRDWLTVRGTLGAELSSSTYGTLERRGEGGFIGPLASLNTGTRLANEFSIARYSLDLGATATRALSVSVSSKTSVGVQYNRRAQQNTLVGANNLPLGGETVAGGTVVSFQEGSLTTAVAGGYVEEVLGFRDRLYLTGALRLDGGSAFGEDFSVVAYPKAGLSWVVTDGHAGPRLPGVNGLRLRAAYGTSGVQPGPTDALALVQVSNGFTVDGIATGPIGILIGGNPDLRPERSSELEAGLDLELWESRVRLEFTAYQRTSDDAIVSRPNGPDVGGSRTENLGSVRNRGLELLLSADLLRGRTLAAGFTATGSLNDNTLLRLGEGVLVSSPTAEVIRQDVGYPVSGLWGIPIESFADANGNGIIEPSEIVFAGPNSQFLGSSFPRREATLAPYLKLFGDGLRLNGVLQYRGGFSRFTSALDTCIGGDATCQAANDPSTPLDEQARAVGFSCCFFGPAAEDASHLILREVSLGFTLPRVLTHAIGAQAGQVVLAGRNVALLWKASPVPIESAGLSFASVDAGNNPGPSTYWLLRLNLTY